MNIAALRRVDYWVGLGSCALLTLHRRLTENAATRAAARARSQRLLFIKLIEQGATVLAYDAVRRATDQVGRENVFFCVFAENRGILDLMNVLPPENVFAIRTTNLRVLVVDTLRALRAIRHRGIDTAVDMEFLSRGSAILAYLTGARRRVGLHRFTEEAPYRGDLMTHRVFYNPFLHTARAYTVLLEALDGDPDDVPMAKIPVGAPARAAPPFVATPDDLRRIEAIVAAAGAGPAERPLVLLNPNSGDMLPLRRWPSERFVELGRRILAAHPGTILITGAPAEADAANALCRAIDSPRARCIAGRTTLRDMLVLYGIADVLVTNDSGPGHFASLTGIDNVVLFGPGAPSQFGPLGGRCHVLWAGLACSPCVTVHNHRSSPCQNNRCMQAITVDDVYAQVRAILGERIRDHRPALEGLSRRADGAS